MEPFNSPTRTDEPSLAQKSSNTKTGPSNTVDENPSNDVVFSSSTISSTQLVNQSTTRPCFLSEPYMPRKLFCGPNQDPGEISVEIQTPINFVIPLNALPLTKCTQHGNIGFLPFDYVNKFHEHIHNVRKNATFQMPYAFEDCSFEFPQIHPIGSSIQRSQEFCLGKCYQCHMDLSIGRDIYMYKDCGFCSTDCRNHAIATRDYYKKMMKAAKNYVDTFGA